MCKIYKNQTKTQKNCMQNGNKMVGKHYKSVKNI